MKEDEVAVALKRLQAPAPDPEARLRAKRAAMAEFARTQSGNAGRIAPAAATSNNVFQALWRRLRPSRDDNHGSTAMNWTRNRGLMAGAAGVCVVALGLTLVWPNLTRDIADVGGAQTLEATVGHPPSAASGPPAQSGLQEPRDLSAAGAATEATFADSSGVMTELPPSDSAVSPHSQPRAERAVASPTAPAPGDARQQSAGNSSSPAIVTTPYAPPAPQFEELRADETGHVVVSGIQNSMKQSVKVRREAVGLADSGVATVIGVPGNMPREELERPVIEEGRDRFQAFVANPVKRVADDPLSTFSADVDTASYSFVRTQLNFGRLPQKDAVRAEEMINYFDYAWPAANSREAPFKPTVVVSESPWNQGRKLVHVGIKGYELRGETPDANLVLLLDVSGSMDEPNKLPLAIRSMEMLLDSLKPTDTVAIVVYAGAAGTVLEPTPVREKARIITALRTLRAGGSTAGAQGIERAYELAERHFRKGGVNRVLLATDGDFNVGIDSTDELKGYIERQRVKGIYLSVLGFGQGNYRDELAQALAQNGNGVAAYIDTENEARKVLVEEASSSLFPIATDVKFQVEFNSATVSEYRLVGYETRALRHEDFNNDAIDAGDIGAGHSVTAIYEITPVGVTGSVDEPRYEDNRRRTADERRARAGREEYGFVKIRYKLPDEDKSRLISEPIRTRSADVPAAISRDVAFSTAVAGFAQLLRGGAYTGPLSYDDVIRQAEAARGEDRFGYRAEFIQLVRKAKSARGM
jgi:Ca-activated chloride channel family protein